jgi:hypothetical protein
MDPHGLTTKVAINGSYSLGKTASLRADGCAKAFSVL